MSSTIQHNGICRLFNTTEIKLSKFMHWICKMNRKTLSSRTFIKYIFIGDQGNGHTTRLY